MEHDDGYGYESDVENAKQNWYYSEFKCYRLYAKMLSSQPHYKALHTPWCRVVF
jgi:hypothetical protein